MVAQYSASGILLHRQTAMLFELPSRISTKDGGGGVDQQAVRNRVRITYTALPPDSSSPSRQGMAFDLPKNVSRTAHNRARAASFSVGGLAGDATSLSHLDDVYPGK